LNRKLANRDPLRYLKARGSKWHYVRRVPGHFSHIDDRGTIRISLKTSSLDVAQIRRDALERADDLYWQGLALDDPGQSPTTQYTAAKARAIALGFEYKAAAEIAASASVEEIIRRVAAAVQSPRDEVAALGGADEPRLTVKKAMEAYIEEIATDEHQGRSESQLKKWKQLKTDAADTFCEVISDKPLLDITRADATKFHRWWLDRIKNEGISGNTANRTMGNMRKLFREYAKHLQLEIKNPFDGLSFKDPKRKRRTVPPFETDFIRKRLLKGTPFKTLNREARLIFLALVETGCRPSEICNLKPENIHLKAKVPYISVKFTDDRMLKTENSMRDIPLVGVSLEAMKRAPNGFPRYLDKEVNFSAAAMKYMRENHLFPTDHHKVYSIRHSYEKRMLEAGYDDEFRRRILGHDIDRPEYGDGGSLAWRAERMKAIALSYDASVLD
jgi:integrase